VTHCCMASLKSMPPPLSSSPSSKRRPSESRPTDHEAKRVKGNVVAMSKVQGKRPEVVDLTKSRSRSTFQPQHGAKKLVIKNLRTTSRENDLQLEQYYQKTWDDLDGALKAIFARKQPNHPFERLYRGVEDICRRGDSKKLCDFLRQRCEAYLNGDLRNAMRAEAGSTNIEITRNVHKYWVIWNQQSVCPGIIICVIPSN
jgi:cullin-4